MRIMKGEEKEVGRTSSQPRGPEMLLSLDERMESPGVGVHEKETLGEKEGGTKKVSFALHHCFPLLLHCGSQTPPSRGCPACSASRACLALAAC